MFQKGKGKGKNHYPPRHHQEERNPIHGIVHDREPLRSLVVASMTNGTFIMLALPTLKKLTAAIFSPLPCTPFEISNGGLGILFFRLDFRESLVVTSAFIRTSDGPTPMLDSLNRT